ncbi:TonB family protein [Pendulispora albinea]|uniref:TonB family protein n=1 Tax=Pendulispora albinea TaxID=2741071 RepID=A0ABZ2MCQ1_9BACT
MPNHPSPTSDGVAQLHSKYRPILEIGQGGMSRVDLALVRGPGKFTKLQVIKRLLPTLATDSDFLEMFLEEARLSARLNHANIVQINEIDFDGVHHFMAMEYLEGQTLDAVVRASSKRGGIPMAMHLRIIAEACAGLHYAHELTDLDGKPLHIVHRDVSPHNVIVTYNGQVKVLDFGIAKAADSSHHTRTGVVKGKCAYMAPEQFQQGRIDRRADIFALGIMVWQAATGTRMWKRLSDVEIFHRLTLGEIPSPLSVDPSLPAELVAICDRALALNCEDRFATAQELGEAIEAYLATLPDPPSARAIGKYVGELFAENRAKVKAAIDAELKRSENSPATISDIPVFVDPESASSDSGASVSPSASPTPPTLQVAGEDLRGSGGYDPSSHPSHPSVDPREVGRGGFQAGFFALLLGGAIVLTLGAAFGLPWWHANRGTQTAHPFGGAPAGAAPNTAPGASANGAPLLVVGGAGEPGALANQTIVLKVKVIPHSASVFIDDVPLSSNPGTARFVRDTVAHRIVASATGYARQLLMVTYDEPEKEVTITLDREQPAGAGGSAGGGGGQARVTGRTHRGGAAAETPPTVITQGPSTPTPSSTVSPPEPSTPPPPTSSVLPTPAPMATAAPPPPGNIDLGGIRATIRNHSGEVQDCYDRAHLERSDLRGQVVVSSIIGAQGQVLSANVSQSTADSARLEQCLIRVFERWTFPQPAGGVNGTVTYTFKFN